MSNMWLSWWFPLSLAGMVLGNMSPYFFCSDMNPQQNVNIEQLMGMWYGIEIIKHNVEQHYTRTGYTCPILHLSEDKDYPLTTYSPLYRNYDYGYNYGEPRLPTRPTNQPTYEYDKHGRKIPPDSRRYNIRDDYNRQQRIDAYNRNFPYGMKRLRIWWDENGKATEYHLKYNTSRPGFWISHGPQNGSVLETKYSNFAGTVQVIKAVGNHMVLTFCHQLPERQLITVLLSRENKLGQPDIHGVHNLLNRKGLSTNAITKVCFNGSENLKISLGTLCLVVIHFLLFRF